MICAIQSQYINIESFTSEKARGLKKKCSFLLKSYGALYSKFNYVQIIGLNVFTLLIPTFEGDIAQKMEKSVIASDFCADKCECLGVSRAFKNHCCVFFGTRFSADCRCRVKTNLIFE